MYSVVTGDIHVNVLYFVAGAQSVVYNSVTYSSGQAFRGVSGVKSFTYSGSGTQALYEVLEFTGAGIDYVESGADQPIYSDLTSLKGFAIEYALNDAEKIVQEITKITGFAIELVDYPFYCFEIMETRL